MTILIINGPNLNLLGKREPGIYGSTSFEVYLERMRERYPEVNLEYFQSNVEGEIINRLQESSGKVDGIILNAGGYSHTSVVIADAVKAGETPLVEVHISQIFGREEYRHNSLIAPHTRGTIIGFGLESYHFALLSFITGPC
ncbi:MAG: 3-dehydroquinate dehydratase [Bacteroidales bacterium]|nr:3-dehydroquinate dehydratase [Bacteroidales bacterium]